MYLYETLGSYEIRYFQKIQIYVIKIYLDTTYYL